MTVLRTSSCVIALNAMVAAVSMTAQAANETLALACQGTMIDKHKDAKPESISMGIIVNRTVHGFGYPGREDFPVKITAMDEVTVVFGGSGQSKPKPFKHSIHGNIDRVTGDVEATSTLSNAQTGSVTVSTYALKCRLAERMF
jgi:hypothetical protein